MTDTQSIIDAAREAKDASRLVAYLPTDTKNAVLRSIADALESSTDELLSANRMDLDAARADAMADAKVRRLGLTPESIGQMAEGVRQIASMPDPVGSLTRDDRVESGLRVTKVRAPLGVVAMIYEARPGVTVDAFSLCFKAGNACMLKGGREAGHSNAALQRLVRHALAANDCPEAAISLVTTSDRDAIKTLLQQSDSLDLVIPRGGESLIRFVHEHATVPTVQHFQGVCHAYVDASADRDMALNICTTAKTSAPATCNTLECVLVHREIADVFVPRLLTACNELGVEVRGDQAVCSYGLGAIEATDSDWGREYLDEILAVRVVGSLDEGVDHIARYGTDHTECVIARDEAVQRAFASRVTSSCVLVNASTRFNDGFQLGLGAEIGISTSRVHAYGPMGLEELTTQRWVVWGEGQTR